MLMFPLALAIEECSSIVEPIDIPCKITSLWNYTPPCNGHIAKVYDSQGNNTINYTYQNYGITGKCQITWNLTETGSYIGVVDNGDTFNVFVKVDNLQLATIIALGLAAGIMLFLAFKLDREHIIMQIGLIIFSMILLSLIPASLILGTTAIIFHKVIMGFMIVFWTYVGVYFIYYVLRWMGIITK